MNKTLTALLVSATLASAAHAETPRASQKSKRTPSTSSSNLVYPSTSSSNLVYPSHTPEPTFYIGRISQVVDFAFPVQEDTPITMDGTFRNQNRIGYDSRGKIDYTGEFTGTTKTTRFVPSIALRVGGNCVMRSYNDPAEYASDLTALRRAVENGRSGRFTVTDKVSASSNCPVFSSFSDIS